VGKTAAQYGKKPLVVTSGSSSRTGVLKRVTDYLAAEGLEYGVFDKVQPNPLTTTAMEAAELVRTGGYDVIIGLGGGSAMDSAKAVAFAAVNPGDISEYIFGKPGIGALPIIAITTTAGTGSEGNCVAVLTNPANNDKKGLKSPHIFPEVAIVDPELMTTLPKRSVAGPGLDAIFHAIESYLSIRSNPLSEMLALEAIRLIGRNLHLVYADPHNLEAWEGVTLANTLAGMAIDSSGTTLPHAMEHPLSGLLDVAHGEGLAALYVAILEFTCPAAQEKFVTIAKAMGENIENLPLEAAAIKCIDAVKKLMNQVEMVPSLQCLGVTVEQLDWLTSNTFKTMSVPLNNNPRVPTAAEVKEIYRKCLG
jgi:alcohol dehydrogenase class IV